MSDSYPAFPPGKAVIFNGHGEPFEFVTKEVPLLKTGEILVKTIYTTLCGSDIHTYCGRRMEPPHVVLGHEIVGDIIWIDPSHSRKDFNGESIAIGDRITWSIFAVPEGIEAPRPDMPQKSTPLFKYGHVSSEGNNVFNGGLADYCIIQSNTALIKLSPAVPVKVAATISCAHSTVMGGVRVAGDISGKKVLVIGAGLLGLSCVAMCREAGAYWIGLADIDQNRLIWGKKFGTDDEYVITGDNNFQIDHEVDIVFDMTGNANAMRMGIDLLSIGGIAVWIGAVYPGKPVEIDAQKIVRKMLQIRGLYNYNYDDFVNATAFIESNHDKYPFEALVEEEYTLDKVEEAFAYATDKKPVRVGVKIN
ncbi:MAG: zinc-binding dehydrogenase [Chitinophagaceae bacterium]